MATKVLNFYGYNVQKETVVMLMFEPPNTSQLYQDQFPVVWKTLKFKPNRRAHAKSSVTYTDRLAFGYMETQESNLIEPSAWIDVQFGDVAVISGGLDSQCFGEVTHRTNNDHIICKNRSSVRVDLSLGLVRGEGVNERFEPVHFWDNVGYVVAIPVTPSPFVKPFSLYRKGSNVTANSFTPILTAYVTNDHKGAEYLRGEANADAIWSQNLDELDDITEWNFVEDPESGVYSITEATSD
ncbi:hypothetical protein FRC12_002475 [Ceratobasidium sp. 428]|nr:hypothetical protein FRC12_002475 [Ceratobasidium sp. 428]